MSADKVLTTKGSTAKASSKKTPAARAESEAPAGRHRKWARGVVVSDKMNKTRVVRVDRQVKDEFYKKYLVKSNKFKAHDEKNESRLGDIVVLVETRPLSRDKRWAVSKIERRAGAAALQPVPEL